MSAVLSPPPAELHAQWVNAINDLFYKKFFAKKAQNELWALLEEGIDIDVVVREKTFGCAGTALTLAFETEAFHLASWLLDRGANPNPTAGEIDIKPLAYAVCFKHLELAQKLIACGADVNGQDQEGHTPLMLILADEDPSLEMLNFLLGKGADIQLQDKKGRTIFDQMDDHTPLSIIQRLEAEKAFLHRENLNQQTVVSLVSRPSSRI